MNPATALQQRCELTLYVVQTAPYARLDIVDMIRPHWILSHVRAGDVQTGSRGVQARAQVGDVMLHVPNLPFSETAIEAGTHQWMAFDVTTGAGQELFRQYPVSPVVRLREPERYAETFARLEQCCAQASSPVQASIVGEMQAASFALELFAHVLDSWERTGSVPRPAALQTAPDRFQEVIAYMQAHLHEKLTRDDLARLVHLHPGYFDRAWRAAYGASPLALLRDMRLRHARALLERTDATLDHIAQQCGMGEAAHFSRVFRAHIGQSPGQYRQRARTARHYAPAAGMPYGVEE